jgi:sortase (surface protein transpeptidase)
MLIDGHVSSWTAHGIFYGIKNLIPGDIIKIQRGDGTVFVYNVVRSQVYQSGNVDMTSAMSPVTPGQPGLNLITCTGDVIPGTSEFNERIVVYATLQ